MIVRLPLPFGCAVPSFFHRRIALFLATGVFGAVACERPDVSARLALLTAPKWHLSDYAFCADEPAVPGA